MSSQFRGRVVAPAVVGAIADNDEAFGARLPEALAVLETALPSEALRNLAPIARIDARARPDVADLWRLLTLEPHMQTGWRWLLPSPGSNAQDVLLLDVYARKPARCEFSVAFTLPLHQLFLEIAAELGRFGLSVGPMKPHIAVWCFRPPRDELLAHLSTLVRDLEP